MSAEKLGEILGGIAFWIIVALVIFYFINRSSGQKDKAGQGTPRPTQPGYSISCSYLSPTEKGNLIMHGVLSLDGLSMTFKGPGPANLLQIPYPDIKKAYLIMQSSELPPEVQASEVFSSFCASKLVMRVDYEADDMIETRYLSGKPADMHGFIGTLNNWRTHIKNGAGSRISSNQP